MKPQLPITTVVTPCQHDEVPRLVPHHLGIHVGVGVDEARGHHQAVGVDVHRRGRPRDRPDLDDPSVRDAHVGAIPGRTRAIDNRAASNHQIVCHATSPIRNTGTLSHQAIDGTRAASVSLASGRESQPPPGRARPPRVGKNGAMRAALYERMGSAAEVLRLEELGRPEPGPGEVRVRLVVSGVNPTDWKTRAGVTARPIDGFQIPNQDGAGVIDAVGEGVDRGRVGERVWVWMAAAGRRWGTAAEWTVVPDRHASHLPDEASFELGASLGVPAMTAHRCLFADGGIEGRVVLVAGGAGAVGHFAIELGKRGGARVVTTISNPEKGKLAQAAGADAIVNYRDADAAQQIKAFAPAVDRIIEVALASNLELDLSVGAPHAVIAAYAATGEDPRLPVRECMNRNIMLRFILLYGVPEEALLWAAGDITEALQEGRLTELPVKRFGLPDIAAAHEAVEAGFPGKVLVDLT